MKPKKKSKKVYGDKSMSVYSDNETRQAIAQKYNEPVIPLEEATVTGRMGGMAGNYGPRRVNESQDDYYRRMRSRHSLEPVGGLQDVVGGPESMAFTKALGLVSKVAKPIAKRVVDSGTKAIRAKRLKVNKEILSGTEGIKIERGVDYRYLQNNRAQAKKLMESKRKKAEMGKRSWEKSMEGKKENMRLNPYDYDYVGPGKRNDLPGRTRQGNYTPEQIAEIEKYKKVLERTLRTQPNPFR